MKKKIFCAICCIFILVTALSTVCNAAVDWTSYASANLIPLPYTSGAVGSTLTVSGVTQTVNEDGSITFSGTSTASFYFWLNDSLELSTRSYYLSYTIDGDSTDGLWVGWDTNNGSTYGSTGVINATSNNPYRIFLAFQANKIYNFTIQVMLNKGSIIYPYQPYIPYYVNSAQFSPDLWNIFHNANSTVYIKNYSEQIGTTYQQHSFTPQLFTGGIRFGNAYSWVADNVLDDEFVDLTIDLNLESPFSYLDTPLYYTFYGNDYAPGIFYLTTTENVRYSAIPEREGDHYKVTISDTINTYPVLIKKIQLTINQWQALSGITIYTTSYIYDNGYANGYNNGIQASNQTIYNQGKTEGYKNGFIEGKAEGLALSETGDWRSLISAVLEAPVNTFQSLFSFEILGMDMQKAIGAILALCVILIIIKKVVL